MIFLWTWKPQDEQSYLLKFTAVSRWNRHHLLHCFSLTQLSLWQVALPVWYSSSELYNDPIIWIPGVSMVMLPSCSHYIASCIADSVFKYSIRFHGLLSVCFKLNDVISYHQWSANESLCLKLFYIHGAISCIPINFVNFWIFVNFWQDLFFPHIIRLYSSKNYIKPISPHWVCLIC